MRPVGIMWATWWGRSDNLSISESADRDDGASPQINVISCSEKGQWNCSSVIPKATVVEFVM